MPPRDATDTRRIAPGRARGGLRAGRAAARRPHSWSTARGARRGAGPVALAGSGTPEALAADTSAQIVVRYLDGRGRGSPVRAVTNNHFDEDGLFAHLAAARAPGARRPPPRAGRGGRRGRRLRHLDRPAGRARGDGRDGHGRAGPDTVPRGRPCAGPRAPARPTRRARSTWPSCPATGGLLGRPGALRPDWRPVGPRGARHGPARLGRATGSTTVPEGDLAIVRAPRPLHAMAVHPRTARTRVLSAAPDGTLVLVHRYETWVTTPRARCRPGSTSIPCCRAPGRRARAGRLELRRGGAHPAAPLRGRRAGPARPLVAGAREGGRRARRIPGPAAIVSPSPGRLGGSGDERWRRSTATRAPTAAVGRQHAEEPPRPACRGRARTRFEEARGVAREAGLPDSLLEIIDRRLEALDQRAGVDAA